MDVRTLMALSIYEQQDGAMHDRAPLPCYRCGRRSYVAAKEWDLFTRMQITEVETRCAGCGETVTHCLCPCARSGCGAFACEHVRRGV